MSARAIPAETVKTSKRRMRIPMVNQDTATSGPNVLRKPWVSGIAGGRPGPRRGDLLDGVFWRYQHRRERGDHQHQSRILLPLWTLAEDQHAAEQADNWDHQRRERGNGRRHAGSDLVPGPVAENKDEKHVVAQT